MTSLPLFTAQDLAAIAGVIAVVVGVVKNLNSTWRVVRPARPAHDGHPAVPETVESRAGSHALYVGMIMAGTVMSTLYGPALVSKLAGGAGTSNVATSDEATPEFTYDAATGKLALKDASAALPSGYVVVAKYVGGNPPLTGDQLTRGTVLGAGKEWSIPENVSSVEARLWNKDKKLATPFRGVD